MIKVYILDALRCILGPLKRFWKRNRCLSKGQNVKIQYGAEVVNTTFEKNGFVAHHAQMNDVTVGNFTSIGRYTKIRCADIGKYCSISWDVTIGAVEHPLTKLSTAALTYKAEYHLILKDENYPQKRTVIGNDVWIGCNAVIRSGIIVGDGAVIGGGSVCVKDIPPYSIVAGNPATIIRMRVEPDLIERIVMLHWWDWSSEDLKANLDLLSADLTADVVAKLETYKTKQSFKEN